MENKNLQITKIIFASAGAFGGSVAGVAAGAIIGALCKFKNL
jgi:hypothetical protein